MRSTVVTCCILAGGAGGRAAPLPVAWQQWAQAACTSTCRPLSVPPAAGHGGPSLAQLRCASAPLGDLRGKCQLAGPKGARPGAPSMMHIDGWSGHTAFSPAVNPLSPTDSNPPPAARIPADSARRQPPASARCPAAAAAAARPLVCAGRDRCAVAGGDGWPVPRQDRPGARHRAPLIMCCLPPPESRGPFTTAPAGLAQPKSILDLL